MAYSLMASYIHVLQQAKWLDRWPQLDASYITVRDFLSMLALPDTLWSRRLFDLVDVNFTGCVAFNDFVTGTYRLLLLDRHNLLQTAFRVLSRRGAAGFNAAVTVLDHKDARTFAALRYPRLSAAAAARRGAAILAALDEDGSGGVSFAEFAAFGARNPVFLALAHGLLSAARRAFLGGEHWAAETRRLKRAAPGEHPLISALFVDPAAVAAAAAALSAKRAAAAATAAAAAAPATAAVVTAPPPPLLRVFSSGEMLARKTFVHAAAQAASNTINALQAPQYQQADHTATQSEIHALCSTSGAASDARRTRGLAGMASWRSGDVDGNFTFDLSAPFGARFLGEGEGDEEGGEEGEGEGRYAELAERFAGQYCERLMAAQKAHNVPLRLPAYATKPA
ncbi:hypothetical protein JKP88DRAFT_248481 [Tribonema minus]|uniref:EF-hand domain-containing protein n=1 Tax=Tribonema minus TaxID=303371 RepID=A0A836CA45_9STRA|nr:hypothetical protein JKP88DRAFT_248481 [Tribonema minus]